MFKLSPPWNTFHNEIYQMFCQDPDINIEYDERTCTTKLYVADVEKAQAISALLPTERTFGNITAKVNVYPANTGNVTLDTFEKAFKGNPALSYTQSVEIPDIHGKPLNFVVFQKEVVQFYNDDISDIHGNCSTLYQNIAEDIFGEYNGVFYCTDVDK